jgi:hypothetical protein
VVNVTLGEAVKRENGMQYRDRIFYQDTSLINVMNYNELLNKDVIFKKMGDSTDYII